MRLASLSCTYSRICNFFILRQFLPVSYPSKLNWVNCKVTIIYRSSCPEVFCKYGVLRNFAKFIGKHLCQSHLFNKVAGLRPATLLKKRLCNRWFPVNFLKFLRTPSKTPIYIICIEIQANFSEAVNWRNIFPRNCWCYLTFSKDFFSQNTSVAASEFI